MALDAGVGRGKGPSRLWAGAPPHTRGLPRPPFPLPRRSCLRPARTNPCPPHSGLTLLPGGVSPTTPPQWPSSYSLGVTGDRDPDLA